MTNKEVYSTLLHAAEHTIKSWQKADKITPIEQVAQYNPVVAGIGIAASRLLPFEMYMKWKEEVQKMGGSV